MHEAKVAAGQGFNLFEGVLHEVMLVQTFCFTGELDQDGRPAHLLGELSFGQPLLRHVLDDHGEIVDLAVGCADGLGCQVDEDDAAVRAQEAFFESEAITLVTQHGVEQLQVGGAVVRVGQRHPVAVGEHFGRGVEHPAQGGVDLNPAAVDGGARHADGGIVEDCLKMTFFASKSGKQQKGNHDCGSADCCRG